ncbi:hypothetical protein JRQ81_006202 [Phrynocephalus forsythii]|uniref:Uncharacterized protein n=1 Tax=Phrynocephalus forsythii TaxID=171643 RepID=A0A9Q0Y5M0_9SAUR|nr:hypothetical protein JRQ81_006202 [Phrynocephalus forsythii]
MVCTIGSAPPNRVMGGAGLTRTGISPPRGGRTTQDGEAEGKETGAETAVRGGHQIVEDVTGTEYKVPESLYPGSQDLRVGGEKGLCFAATLAASQGPKRGIIARCCGPRRTSQKPSDVDGAGMGWQKSQEKQETWPRVVRKVDYKSEPATYAAAAASASGSASCKEDQGPEASQNGKDKCAASTGVALKDQGSAAGGGKELGGLHADRSKNSGIVTYLKNLYSDLPVKSSPESSTGLTIDTNVVSS